jgi:RNA recognition motif-containing protein
MEILNQANIYFLLTLVSIIGIFTVYYYSAVKKQNRALSKVDTFLKRQEQANQHLNTLVHEIRRSNRLLAELADLDPIEEPVMPASSAIVQQPTVSSTSADIESSALESTDPQYKLYVGNIDYAATEAELGEYFKPYGTVEFVNIPVNRYTGKARGFGFVSFTSKEDAERAMALHGSEFKGRQIQVNFAKERDREIA